MRSLLLIISFLISTSHYCQACLWDYDTLAMERLRFPEAHELIAGYFVRHSPAYYEWRISDRLSTPEEKRTPRDYDDIAVAFDKLGQHDKAIETIQAKVAKWPDQLRYESEANWGTFLIHSGRYEEGLEHINRAIEINPDAHFGREVYQKLLVEYLLYQRERDSQPPPEIGSSDWGDNEPKYEFVNGILIQDFGDYVLAYRKNQDRSKYDEIQAGVKGVLGMMRFGNHESPILLEALGDMLLGEYPQRTDSKMLAARAYLKAAYHADGEAEASKYRSKAKHALTMQYERELSEIEAELNKEIEQGNKLFAQITADETAWINSDKNLDVEFKKSYYEVPLMELSYPNWRPMNANTYNILVDICVFVVIAVVAVLLHRFFSRVGNPKKS